MLILTRKPNQKIMIGNDMCITIIGIQYGIVKLKIDAPENCNIYKSELNKNREEFFVLAKGEKNDNV